MNIALLGGLSARQFIRQYWQKKPLLVRQAIPGFGAALSPGELAGLACEDTAQSRLVTCQKGRWQLEQGPFDAPRFARLPAHDWSLLVQSVNHFLPEADALLSQFDFLPRARLDDVMVSLAPKGGGVGPHFDSYDVFLLQGRGRRWWRISSQQDMALIEGAPLRILQHFHTEHEWVLEPGDMLYLPPRLAHWGIAADDGCMTWSIGFRAPSTQELATQFLLHLHDQLALPGMYADADLRYQSNPAEISTQMVRKVQTMLREIRWNADDVAHFLGLYLTEPKSHMVFDRPRAMSMTRFLQQCATHTVKLALQSQMLFHAGQVFINGECVDASASSPLRQLATQRVLLPGAPLPQDVIALLHQWYLAGYVVLEKP